MDDIDYNLGSFAFIMGHMLTPSPTVFSGNFGVFPGGHLLMAAYLREFRRQGGSVDAMSVAHAAHIARTPLEDITPGERSKHMAFAPHQERFVAWLAATGRQLRPEVHVLVQPGDIVVAHHLLPHDAVRATNDDPGTDRICVFYRFDHRSLSLRTTSTPRCQETTKRWDSLTDPFSLGWTPLQAARAGTAAARPEPSLLLSGKVAAAPPSAAAAAAATGKDGCTGRVLDEDGEMPEQGSGAGRKVRALPRDGRCTAQADCNGWHSPLLEQGYFFCSDKGRCRRCAELVYVPDREPYAPAAAAAAAVGGGGMPFKYAFNSLDGALPLMCPGLDLDYDVNLYGLPFAKVIKEQQVAGRAATHASAPYKWAHDMMEKTIRQADAEGILQKREAGQVGWAVKSKAEQEAGCRAVLAAAGCLSHGKTVPLCKICAGHALEHGGGCTHELVLQECEEAAQDRSRGSGGGGEDACSAALAKLCPGEGGTGGLRGKACGDCATSNKMGLFMAGCTVARVTVLCSGDGRGTAAAPLLTASERAARLPALYLLLALGFAVAVRWAKRKCTKRERMH